MSEFRTAVHEGVGAAPVSGRHPLSGSSPASSSGVLTARDGRTSINERAIGVLNSPTA